MTRAALAACLAAFLVAPAAAQVQPTPARPLTTVPANTMPLSKSIRPTETQPLTPPEAEAPRPDPWLTHDVRVVAAPAATAPTRELLDGVTLPTPHTYDLGPSDGDGFVAVTAVGDATCHLYTRPTPDGPPLARELRRDGLGLMASFVDGARVDTVRPGGRTMTRHRVEAPDGRENVAFTIPGGRSRAVLACPGLTQSQAALAGRLAAGIHVP